MRPNSHGNLVDPRIAEQDLEISDEPTESKPFHKLTRAIRIQCDRDCRIAIGTDPAAPKFPLTAGQPLQRVVPPGEGFRVFAVAAPSHAHADGGAGATASLFDLLAMITNPAKAKAALEKHSRAKADADSAIAQLGDLRRAAADLAKQQAAFAAEVSAEHARHQEVEHRLAAEREELEAAKRKHVAAAEALALGRAALEQSRRAHELALAEMNRLRNVLNANAA